MARSPRDTEVRQQPTTSQMLSCVIDLMKQDVFELVLLTPNTEENRQNQRKGFHIV